MNICVYGASSNRIDPSYLAAGEELGALIAQGGHRLVFGGGANGMMGAAARGAYAHGGEILGISPSFFNVDGILYDKCTEFIYTETMRERKALLEEKSHGFVMTAGGIGTFEEFFEILTLKQLGKHNKPIAVLNTNGYYDHMAQMLQAGVEGEFMQASCLDLYKVCQTPQEVMDYLLGYDEAAKDIRQLKNI